MKPIKSLLVLAIVCVPAFASAQGYYGRRRAEPVAGGFHNRAGRLAFGFGIGLGGLSDSGSGITSCDNCDVKPLTFEADVHIGGMLTPQLALLFEAQGNLQTVQRNGGFDSDTTLSQGVGLFAAQFWVLPQFWIKGGIGFSHLQVDDGYFTTDFGSGSALLAAAGFEVFSARNFALDLQGRLLWTSYNSFDDNLTSATVGIGVSWY
jgi:hypothetical protein